MARVGIGTFTHYDLTEREQLAGSILTNDQKCVIQNERAAVAQNKLNLEYNPRAPLEFAQSEAFLKGQLSVLDLLLNRSDDCETNLMNLSNSIR